MVGSGKARRRIKVAPVARAVRAALAVSAAALALAGSGAAVAGDCGPSLLANPTGCSLSIQSQAPAELAVHDLTRVAGDVAPSSVTFAPAMAGNLPGPTAIATTSDGDVSIENSGAASAYGLYDVTAIRAETTGVGTSASDTNTGTGQDTAGSYLGFAIGIAGYA